LGSSVFRGEPPLKAGSHARLGFGRITARIEQENDAAVYRRRARLDRAAS